MLIPMSTGLISGSGSPLILGTWINTNTNANSQVYDFTSIPFLPGDLLIALFTDDDKDSSGEPLGSSFTQSFYSTSGSPPAIGVYTKIADGTETTFDVTNSNRSQVSTLAIRNAVFGQAASLYDGLTAPALTNSAGDMVFTLFSRRNPPSPSTPPSGYTSLFSGSGENSFQHLAVKENAPTNESPGTWVGGTSRHAILTFSVASP